jgi:DNA-binding transcriptional regulator YiaG
MAQPSPPLHLRLSRQVDQATERLAVRAALTAAHLLGLATGIHLRSARGHDDPLTKLQAKLEEAELRARLAGEIAEILGARLRKIPERHRPYFTPAQRFRILEIRSLLGWSAPQVAKVFLVRPNTILNWERGADREGETVGSLVKPTPPIRRAADVVRSLVQTMSRLGYGGQDLVARILARAGWLVSARSVGRYRRERPVRPSPPTPTPTPRKTRPVIARFVHHTWMMDVSLVRQFLGPDLYMAAVFDAFSRVPLSLSVLDRAPTAFDMARLLRSTVKAFSVPKYLITDRGGEFTG